MARMTIEMMLDVARDIVARPEFDAEVATGLLTSIPFDDLDLQTIGAVTHAKLAAITAMDGSTARIHEARLALSRVVMLLEQHVDDGTPRPQ